MVYRATHVGRVERSSEEGFAEVVVAVMIAAAGVTMCAYSGCTGLSEQTLQVIYSSIRNQPVCQPTEGISALSGHTMQFQFGQSCTRRDKQGTCPDHACRGASSSPPLSCKL